MTDDHKRKISEANRGRKWSDEAKRQASVDRKGKSRPSPTPETIEKIRAGNIGKKKRRRTEAEKAHQSERMRKFYEVEANRLAQSARIKAALAKKW